MSVSPPVKLVQEWGNAFQTGNLDLLERCLHKDYHHITYPRSIDQKTYNKVEFIEQLRQIVPQWTESKFTNEVKTKFGASPPYESIVIATIVTDDDGTLKIGQIEEFIDSKIRFEQMKAFAAK